MPMTTRRGRVAATLVKNKIFVCGGSDGQEELDTGEYLDLDFLDKWMPIKDLPTRVVHGGNHSTSTTTTKETIVVFFFVLSDV